MNNRSGILTYAALTAAMGLLMAGCMSFDPVQARHEHMETYSGTLDRMAENLLARPVSLADCVAVALTNNFEVKCADLDRNLGRVAMDMSYSLFLPKVAADAGYVKYGKNPLTVSQSYGHGGISASMDVFQPASWFMYDAARHGVASSEMAAAYVRQGIVLETTRNYFSVLVQEDLIRAYESQLAAADEMASRVSGLAAEGLARGWEAEQARSIAMSKRADLERARREMAVVKAELLQGMGLSPLSAVELRGEEEMPEAPEGSIEELVLRALETHPRLSMADRAVVSAEADVRRAICSFIPTVSIFVSPSFSNNKVMNPPTENISLGFSSAWTIFSGFYNVGVYKQARTEKRRSEYERENAFLSVISCVISAEAALRDAGEISAVYESVYAAARTKYEDYNARGKEGLVPISDVLDAQAEMDAAEVNMVLSRYDERVAVENLKLAMGITELPDEFMYRGGIPEK